MTSSAQHILVATSTHPECDGPLRSGAALAESLGASLGIVHSLGRDGFTSGPFGTGWLDEDRIAAELPHRRELLRKQVKRCGLVTDLATSAVVRAGSAQVVIAEEIQHQRPGLVVIGAPHGIGSIVDRVVRTSSVPVLVARSGSRGRYRSALLATDLSVPSRDAIVEAGRLFQHHSESPERSILFAIESLEEGTASQDVWEAKRRAGIYELARLFEDLEGSDRVDDVDWIVRPGQACEVLRNTAEDFDLVVLGTHGLGGYHRFLVGSVVMETIRSASADVLVVPTGGGDRSWPPPSEANR
ncbi:MAG: universal stress protein [Thermoanaerobaculia bacterium]|nr:universal stress protein [Thermoanaerobaculia bacterium]